MNNHVTTSKDSATPQSLRKSVAQFYRSGVCVIPPVQNGEKRPYPPAWKEFQSRAPTVTELKHWWGADTLTGVGAVCGEISGNLEAMDFDDRQAYAEFKSACIAVGLGDLVARIEAGYLEYSPKGAHWLYRCDEIAGNQKLAMADKQTVLIETRGEGGFIIVAPTYGSVNPKGPYVLVSGSAGTIATITPEEREALLAVARSLCKLPKKPAAPIPDVAAPVSGGLSPFDDYAQRTTWAEILEPQGWMFAYAHDDKQHWRRPGKDTGVSATTFGEEGNFYCFTSSTSFEVQQSYSKAGVYAHLHHGDDFKAAAKALAALGYGTRPAPQASQESAASNEDAAIIQRLAALSLIEYDKVRKDEAMKFGIRVGVLDDAVKAARGVDDEEASSTNILFPEIEPWPVPVSAGDLLAEIAAVFNRVAKLPAHADVAMALWVIFTYCINAFHISPILNITSPEKRCGKSTVLALIQKLVYRALMASNITGAAMFRSIHAWQPTLLVDEADTFVTKEKEELRGIINSGHSKSSAFVVRTVGDDHEPTHFSTWCAKCLAGIGHLPDTVKDRSIIVALRRKLSNEKVEKLRNLDPAQFDALASKCLRFAQDNMLALRSANPALPEELNDRAADNWEPLFAIADIAGGEWPKVSRAAALALAGAEKESMSTNVELLRDIKEIFESKPSRDSLFTHELIAALTVDEESAWATWNRGKPITPRQLATRVKEFGAVVGSVRHGTQTGKGYKKESFEDAFKRYIPASEEQHGETIH